MNQKEESLLYVVTEGRGGLRYHRPRCKRIVTLNIVDHGPTTVAEPATCCRPDPQQWKHQLASAPTTTGAEPAPKPEVVTALPTTSSDKNPLAVRAMAVKSEKGGVRGPGKRLTEAEMLKYIRKVRAKRPDTSAVDEMEIAYWLEGIALSRTRWMQLWAATEPSPVAAVQ